MHMKYYVSKAVLTKGSGDDLLVILPEPPARQFSSVHPFRILKTGISQLQGDPNEHYKPYDSGLT